MNIQETMVQCLIVKYASFPNDHTQNAVVRWIYQQTKNSEFKEDELEIELQKRSIMLLSLSEISPDPVLFWDYSGEASAESSPSLQSQDKEEPICVASEQICNYCTQDTMDER